MMKLSTIAAAFLVAATAAPAFAMDTPPSKPGSGKPGGSPAAVPEPASMLLVGSGAAALAFARRRRTK